MDKPEGIALLCVLLLGSLLVLSVNQFVLGSESSTFTLANSGTVNYSAISPSWLHTSGTNIYDSNDNQVKLWGCVLQNGDGSTYTQADFQTIKNMGFNTIRMWLTWGLLEPTGPTVTDTRSLDSSPFQVDNYVQWATNAGLYVILCAGSSSTWRVPSWVPSGPITCPDGGGSWSLTDSSTLTGIANLYGFIANRYSAYNNLIFEGLNEMSAANDAGDTLGFRNWNNNWLSAVEANEGGTNHLKIIQFMVNYNGGTWTQYLNAYPPYTSGTHSNIVMATHDYFLVDSSQSSSTLNSWASQIFSLCQTANHPWMDTEFSTAIHGGGASALDAGCRAMTRNGISGWGYFCYNIGNQPSSYALPGGQATILPILQPYMVQP
jgi:aryl-phospho-beta-D-glucosidase BglC (GH1 family)